MDSASRYDCVVVGGGLAGTTLAAELALVAPSSFRLLLIDSGAPGPGSAYAPASTRLLMNGSAAAMSATTADKEDLVRWLGGVERGTLIARSTYGQYLRERFARTLEGRPLFEAIAAEAVDVTCAGEQLIVSDAPGNEWSARNVVLALGNFPPDDTFLPQRMREWRGFVSNPWRGTLPEFRGDALIVGSGLTAMDAIVQLDERNFAGAVHLVSRHGLLPCIELDGSRGLDAGSLHLDYSSPLRLLRSMRSAIRRHAARGGDWRDVVEAIRPDSQAIWGTWSERDRRRFLRHLQPFWAVHRYRVPPATRAVFERLEHAGRIVRHRGRVSGGRPLRDGRFSVDLAHGRFSTAVVVGCAINCTGPNGDYAHIRHALVRNLLRSGLVRPDALHLGLDADEEMRVVGRDGSANERIFTLGPPLRGRLYETTAVPEVARQAAQLSEKLVRGVTEARLEAVS